MNCQRTSKRLALAREEMENGKAIALAHLILYPNYIYSTPSLLRCNIFVQLFTS